MISKQWRERLGYAAMSVFVGWHTLAMVVAPAPEESALVKSLHGLLQPYLALFNLGFLCTQYHRKFRIPVRRKGLYRGRSHVHAGIEMELVQPKLHLV
jgi:hypothetical protein